LKFSYYTYQLSRLRIKNLKYLTLVHACRLNSHAWLKNVSGCSFAWHNFQKYANSSQCKKQKLCVNDDTFLLQIESTGSKVMFRNTHPEPGIGKCQGCFCFSYCMQISEDFRHLRKFSDVFGNIQICLWRLQKTQHSQDKNLTPITQKKLAGISSGWQVINQLIVSI